ncbi:C-type cytochrome biogenesis protein CcsB [Candidatus Desulfarcum epimagneticum]|uniref:Heme exporter protein C n=1 Tax=uncultured Desulfobacteraceae bacterium TaxID=218296 RepID=A0A484HI81_9BACT|nr:C-type cytochrome biogenesis protein CcsB [uncultured Desulfobacteraceae bacterium]
MSSSYILSITTFIYGLAAVLYIGSWIFKKPFAAKAAFAASFIGFLTNTAGFTARWAESYQIGFGHAPLSNMYESLVFFAWCVTAIYLFLEYRHKLKAVGAFVMPLAFLVMAYASLQNDQIQPLIPALKSNWLIAHVITCFLGYAAFAVAFVLSVMYLIKKKDAQTPDGALSLFPDLSDIDELTYRMTLFGFLFLTVGIITGAVWANSAWGRYWGWDPKETWSLITWLIYATLLHARIIWRWSGGRIAFFSILGFAAVLFTYLGVNYLPGLHSYGAG